MTASVSRDDRELAQRRAVRRRTVRRRRLTGVAIIVAIGLIAVAALFARATRSSPKHRQQVSHITIVSRFVHAREPVTLVTPPGGGAGRPLLIFLHGHGSNQNSELSEQLFTALDRLGARAPDIAFPYGGTDSYWHDRNGGAWAQYVLKEVIPAALRALHANPARLAIGGISMGGFGAYDIARLVPGKFCAVAGHSAALWSAGADSAPGAFDDAADFAHNNLIAITRADPHIYGRARLWLDGGSQDPFHAADEALASNLGIDMHVWPGGHDNSYWNAHWAAYLQFYSDALARCTPR